MAANGGGAGTETVEICQGILVMFLNTKKFLNHQLCLVGIQVLVILSPCTFPYFFKALEKVKIKICFADIFCISEYKLLYMF